MLCQAYYTLVVVYLFINPFSSVNGGLWFESKSLFFFFILPFTFFFTVSRFL